MEGFMLALVNEYCYYNVTVNRFMLVNFCFIFLIR